MGFFKSILGAVAPVVGGIAGAAIPGIGPAIGTAIGTGIGGALENEQRIDQAESANAFSAAQSNTSYQRAVADLKAAGINPMLVTRMGGASTPIGQQASIQPAAVPAATTAVSAGGLELELARNQPVIEQIEAQTEKTLEEIKNVKRENERIYMTTQMLLAQYNLMTQQNFTEQAKQALMRSQVSKITEETQIANYEVQAIESLSNLGKETSQVKPLIDILRSILMRR